MTEKDEFLAGLAKRLRKLRLHLGYETAASFARAIGYPPDKYSRYERRGILRIGVLMPLLKAIEVNSNARVHYDWLFDFKPGPMFYPSEPQKRPALRLVEGGEARPT